MSELEMRMIIAQMLKEMRSSTGLTLKEAGERAGTTAPSMKRYESGERSPKIGVLKKICEVYGWDFDAFVTEAKRRFSKGDEEEAIPYYIQKDAEIIAQFLADSPEYKVLFDAVKNVPRDDIEWVKSYLDKMYNRE